MKYLLIIVFAFLSTYAQAQDKTVSSRYETARFLKDIRVDSGFSNAVRDTMFTPPRIGYQVVRPQDTSTYLAVSTTTRPFWQKQARSESIDTVSADPLIHAFIRNDSLFIVPLSRDTTLVGVVGGSGSSIRDTFYLEQLGDSAVVFHQPSIDRHDTLTGPFSSIGSGGGTWGSITGTLSAQTDLQAALDAKVAATRTINTTAPLAGGGDLSANRTLSITQATTSTDGYLSSTNWNTFNGKEPAIVAPYTTGRYWNGFKSFVTLNSDSITQGSTNKFYTDALARAALSAGTGIGYNTSTGVISNTKYLTTLGLSSGTLTATLADASTVTTSINSDNITQGSTNLFSTTAEKSNWNTAYNKRITSAAFSGSATKTLTLTQGDGSTVTASFTDSTGTAGTSPSIGGAITSGTAGSVLFIGTNSLFQQKNSDFFYDSTNARLGLGLNSSLAAKLHIKGGGTTSATYGLQIHNSTGTSNSFLVRDDGLSSFGTTPATGYRVTSLGDIKSTNSTTSVTTSSDSVFVALRTDPATGPFIHFFKQGTGQHYLYWNNGFYLTNSVTTNTAATTAANWQNISALNGLFSGTGTVIGQGDLNASTSLNIRASTNGFMFFTRTGIGQAAAIGFGSSSDLQFRAAASSMSSGTHVMRMDATNMNLLVGNTTAAEPRSMFSVQATDRGAIPAPKMTTAQRIAISSGIYGTSYTRTATFTSGGSGYVSATYTNVPLTGGTGTGAQATIVVAGGIVTAVTMTASGTGYVSGDVLSASNTNLGGSGSGFAMTLTTNHFNVTEGVQVYDTDLHKLYVFDGTIWQAAW